MSAVVALSGRVYVRGPGSTAIRNDNMSMFSSDLFDPDSRSLARLELRIS
jgi:hypothetical protein